MWSVKEKGVESLGGKKYLETYGDVTGYVRVFRIPEGIEIWGKVKKGAKPSFIDFKRNIEKKHGKVLGMGIEEVEKEKFDNEVKPEVQEIYERNRKSLKKE